MSQPTYPEKPCVLRGHLLGLIGFEEVVAYQQRLAYEVSEDLTACGMLLLCEHPLHLSLGRTACRTHIAWTAEQLLAKNLHMQWVARGGGVWLHGPGQLAGYSIVPLDVIQRSPAGYVFAVLDCLYSIVREYCPTVVKDEEQPGLLIHGRRVATVGVAIRRGVAQFGFTLNIRPDLELWQNLNCEGDALPMTSLQRECIQVVRPASIRQRLLELWAERFGFEETTIVHHSPALPRLSEHYASIINRRSRTDRR